MKLHWSPRSPFVRKVMVFAHETGLAPKIERVRSVVAMTKPNAALMRDNPLSKIPTLVTDDGTILYDSDVICEYLDTLHEGPKFFPPAGPARWQALRWRALGTGLLDALVLWRNERDKPEARQTPELLAAFQAKLAAVLTHLDGEAAALTATPMNIGHVAIGSALGYLDYRFADANWRNGHAPIAAWFEPVSKRPSFVLTTPGDG